jgi:hypothetical protein
MFVTATNLPSGDQSTPNGLVPTSTLTVWGTNVNVGVAALKFASNKLTLPASGFVVTLVAIAKYRLLANGTGENLTMGVWLVAPPAVRKGEPGSGDNMPVSGLTTRYTLIRGRALLDTARSNLLSARNGE